MNAYLLTVIGLVFLIKGGDFLVKGASKTAVLIGIPKFIVSLTIIAFCTSAPELIVSLKSTLNNQHDIAIGNISGSNIANISLVLGVSLVLLSCSVNKKKILIEWMVMTFSTLAFVGLGIIGYVNYIGGILLLLCFVGYTYYQIITSRKQIQKKAIVLAPKFKDFLPALLFLIIGGVGLSFGSDFLIDGATQIAKGFNVSEYIIGITIIAIGTSIPELTTSIVAAIKKEHDISIGNIIGSNILNVFIVIGVSALFSDIRFPDIFAKKDIYWLTGSCILLAFILFTGKKIGWIKGVLLLIFYTCYILFSL